MKILTNKEYDKLIKEGYEKGYEKGYDEGYCEGQFQHTPNDIEEVNSSVLFDFNNPDIIVYGIERIPRQISTNKIEHTHISYMTKEGARTSWLAYCSRQKHDALITEFADHLKARDTKTNKSKK